MRPRSRRNSLLRLNSARFSNCAFLKFLKLRGYQIARLSNCASKLPVPQTALGVFHLVRNTTFARWRTDATVAEWRRRASFLDPEAFATNAARFGELLSISGAPAGDKEEPTLPRRPQTKGA